MEKLVILWYNETREERIGKMGTLNERKSCTFYPDTYNDAYCQIEAVTFSLDKDELVSPDCLEAVTRFNRQQRFKNMNKRFKKSRFKTIEVGDIIDGHKILNIERDPFVKNQIAITTDEEIYDELGNHCFRLLHLKKGDKNDK